MPQLLSLDTSIWVVGIIGAFLVGLSKGGVPIGNLTVALYALIIPDPKLSVGVLLPILSAADIVGVSIYHRYGQWIHLRKLLPWAGMGVVIGYFLFRLLEGQQVRVLIGGILLGLVTLNFVWQWGRRRIEPDISQSPRRFWFMVAPLLGILCGIVTMLSNAAGPLVLFYCLAMRLPKYHLIGTAAWFFLLINLFKVPFMVSLGIINWTWLPFSMVMMIPAILGAFLGPKIVGFISQSWFNNLTWLLVIVASVQLLWL